MVRFSRGFLPMIPLFPKFKRLSLEDQKDVEAATERFPMYSDFDFVSLWCWNTQENILLSKLHNNLVVRFQHYLTGDLFYSFIGQNQVADTITTLLSFAESEALKPYLGLVPEHVFESSLLGEHSNSFDVVADPDNYDYVLSTEKISSMNGKKLHQKRKKLNKFIESNKNLEIVTSNASDHGVQNEILSFFDEWVKRRGKSWEEMRNEHIAMKRLFFGAHQFQVNIQSLFVNGKLAGYTIFEIKNRNYALSSFQKADTTYEGIYEFLYASLAQYLLARQCRFINIEQDLGLPGLRRSKKDYDPAYLKKYTISPRK